MAEIQNVKIENGVVVFPDYIPNDPDNKLYDYDAAVEIIANLLGVGKRSDGKYHLPDLCVSSRINKWANRKSYPLVAANSEPVTDNAYTINRTYGNAYTNINMTRIGDIGSVKIEGRPEVYDVSFYTAMGMDIPYLESISNNPDACNRVVNIINKIVNGTAGYNWEKSPWGRNAGEYKRIRDFDGYNHNAGFPFAYALNHSIVYRDQDLGISISHVSNNDNISPATLFQSAFGDSCYGAAIVQDPSNGLTLVTGTAKMSSANGGVVIPYTSFRAYPDKTFTAYLFAYDSAKARAIMLPKDSSQSPAVSFKVSPYISTDPFAKLNMIPVTDSSNDDRVGYNTGTSSTFPLKKCTPVQGVSGTLYAPATSGQMVFSMTFRNNTSSAISIDPNYFRFVVRSGYSSTSGVTSKPTIYNSSFSSIISKVSVAAGATIKLYFKITNVWDGLGFTTSNDIVRTLNISLQYNEPVYTSYGFPASYPNLYSVGIAAVYSSAYNGQVAKVNYDGYSNLAIISWTSYANAV